MDCGGYQRALMAFVVVSGALTVSAVPSVAVAASSVVVGGRISFRDATREARAEEVERLRWGHISVEIRNGWQVFSARPDADGLFTITGPPGKYQLEYIRIGQLAEFVVPHETMAAREGVTCLGTIEVRVNDVARDLGNNTGSRLSVRDDCAVIGPALGRRAGGDAAVKASPARPVPTPGWSPHPLDVLVGFRGSVGVANSRVSSLRVDLVLPIHDAGDRGQWLGGATLIHVDRSFVDIRWPVAFGAVSDAHSVWGGAIGGGYNYSLLEAMAWAGALANPGRGAHGPFAGVSLRLGSDLFGFGGRLEVYGTGDRIVSFMADISPFGILGALL